MLDGNINFETKGILEEMLGNTSVNKFEFFFWVFFLKLLRGTVWPLEIIRANFTTVRMPTLEEIGVSTLVIGCGGDRIIRNPAPKIAQQDEDSFTNGKGEGKCSNHTPPEEVLLWTGPFRTRREQDRDDCKKDCGNDGGDVAQSAELPDNNHFLQLMIILKVFRTAS